MAAIKRKTNLHDIQARGRRPTSTVMAHFIQGWMQWAATSLDDYWSSKHRVICHTHLHRALWLFMQELYHAGGEVVTYAQGEQKAIADAL